MIQLNPKKKFKIKTKLNVFQYRETLSNLYKAGNIRPSRLLINPNQLMNANYETFVYYAFTPITAGPISMNMSTNIDETLKIAMGYQTNAPPKLLVVES